MFEIRIICDPADTDHITTALSDTFATGAVRTYPTRDGERTRLYVTADHRPAPGLWPTAEEAYALAPSIIREIGWTAGTAADKPCGEDLDREYWLRKAALLDRIALSDETDGISGDASDAAEAAAWYLIDMDRADNRNHGRPHSPEVLNASDDPRGYVRQEYAHWAKND
ncbi:hypothetical protein [Streptomyces sp. PR69]|uniref:hypothetical protein n=1 Tax=Streptomyces sp. PR69 TaxID=2984950 RepID=UPI002264FF45|nr:hypothetical protein [Streptomyces sp. PR69]